MWCLCCLFHSFESCGVSGQVSGQSRGQLLGANPAEGRSAWEVARGLRLGGGDIHGEGEPRALPCEPPLLSPLRYQEVQAAQKALGTAAAEVLPEAGRALAAAQQADADAALRPASLAAPAALVSPAVLGALHGAGGGECGSWETSVAQAEADDVAYF